MTVQNLVERVERGAELLDEEYPGWAFKIDEYLLDLANASKCVLGQLFGCYSAGLDELKIDSLTEDVEYGFTILCAEDSSHPCWNTLTNLWLAEITERCGPREV